MGAVQMNLGGAPAGPAGTGKTETVKDLAKALARQVVVFNCSDGLDFRAMGKFFKGLASCGAWACFDEFNRIDVEVLSVVAQQIMTLQAGVRAGLPKMVFSDSEIKLDGNFAVFITMNPGYAGRTELPDNLKALFRPVAMMVPDYALIGEIMLFSFGFSAALTCARKMVATFRLCSEQLSSQSHYDYGMRAVMTVIRAAGNLKRADPHGNEEILLYRALQDVNLPKFLAHDIPLFNGILSDLFPGVQRPKIDYGDLMKSLTYCTEKRGLQPVPPFMTKALQLYETVVVRHGLMVVGPTGGGKSSIISVLRDALTLMATKGRTGPKVEKVVSHYLNPKSITMGQLYGMFDENTQEWQDGILADMVRHCADSTTPDLKWVIFDGPVDALWIENMNTVLDDNKKLCLVSGEIIRLSAPMEIMFEVEDLLVASPATVSRCGMVYMEPKSLGYDPLVQSWLEALPACFTPSMKASLQYLADAYIQGALFFLRRYLTEPVPTMDNSLVRSLLNLMDCYFEPYTPKATRDPPTAEAVAALESNLSALFMFSLVWSVSATVDAEGRARFNAYLRSVMEMHAFPTPFPEEGSVYDYVWDVAAGTWMKWMATVPEYVFPSKATFAELIVPTKDSVRYKFLGRTLLTNRKYVLMTGPTGTGKSVNMMEMLSKDMPSKLYVPINLTFSAQTSANQTQDIMDSKMEKRQRGTYGPTVGTYYVLFVDDLNMPQREKYFAQPPIELLRQWCDYGGWYDRKERSFRRIVDTILLAAMGPPGGGRNPITARMIRHFNVINYTPMDDESMFTIFNSILSNFVSTGGFDESMLQLCSGLVYATIAVYNTAIGSLKPTPAKPHYTFNMRDLGKVFQGLLMADARRVEGWQGFMRLWVHETRRVFADRLVSFKDREWFDDELKTQLNQQVGKSWDELDIGKRLLFGDYLHPGADPKVYEEARDPDTVIPIVQEYLADYNVDSKSPMDLVLFMDAVENVSRIARVLRQPQGNCLLLGVGGSGRQSLARLATFMADYTLFQVEVSKGYGPNEWRDDVKTCLMQAGVEQKQIVFLFTDTQIVFEGMVEDVNNILNSGDVPNLYAEEDYEAIYSVCRRECQARRLDATKINMFSQYLLRVRANIHVVMCMSPMGDAFRDRLRMFPALVNCCTINWFTDWPDEALRSVALSSLSDPTLELGESIESCVDFFRGVHQGVAEASLDYREALRRYNYVTPTSYLELLSTFKKVLHSKREEVGVLKDRLQVGLDKLASTSDVVATLQVELEEKQPVLAETQVNVDQMITQIEVDKKAAAETKVQVEAEEAEATKMAAETKAIADDAQADLDKALPALEAATECVKKLKRDDIVEMRGFTNPVASVLLTMHALCVMFGVKPVKVKDPENPTKKKGDYWTPGRSNLLSDPNGLLKSLLEYDKDDIPEAVIKKVKVFDQEQRRVGNIWRQISQLLPGRSTNQVKNR
jgi:dynein heavy chain